MYATRHFINTDLRTATLTPKDDFWMIRGSSWTVPTDTEAEALRFLADHGFREYGTGGAYAAI